MKTNKYNRGDLTQYGVILNICKAGKRVNYVYKIGNNWIPENNLIKTK